MAMPGRAQQAPGGRFAFADTTLMRDTLGLTFEGLFPIADSLGLLPDTLRALSIRHRYTLQRLVKLSDSLGVPVDSVGAVMRRESFSALTRSARQANPFTYTSTYDIQRSTATWTNGVEYSLGLGPMFLRNTTNIVINQSQGGESIESRSSSTEAGWRLSRNMSIGGRLDLGRSDNGGITSGRTGNVTSTNYQLSLRTKQQLARGLTSDLNLFAGPREEATATYEKHGLGVEANGRVLLRGTWLTHDLSGQLKNTSSLARAQVATTSVRTQDPSVSLRGTLGMFVNAPLGLNLNYMLGETRVERPDTSAIGLLNHAIESLRSGNRGVSATLRLRKDNDRSISLTRKYSNQRTPSSVVPTFHNTGIVDGYSVSGRYGYRAWSLDASLSQDKSYSEQPRMSRSGGYREDRLARSAEATLNWDVSRNMTARGIGRVGLTQYREAAIDYHINVPVPRDVYAQSYRVEGNYHPTERFRTGLALEVGRSVTTNLLPSSVATNNESRDYRSEWTWSFRLLPGLTANQRNQMTAAYVYPYRDPINNRLLLEYTTFTTLNAIITPRLQFDVFQDYHFKPNGTYSPLDPPGSDLRNYFSIAGSERNSLIRARISYTPASPLSINLEPEYSANDQQGTSGAIAIPTHSRRVLSLRGGASVNVPVGRLGKLTGGISRNVRETLNTDYPSGTAQSTRSSDPSYWVGNLQLTWQL
jgi:hypothetical protein